MPVNPIKPYFYLLPAGLLKFTERLLGMNFLCFIREPEMAWAISKELKFMYFFKSF
jgi:hypothetical protein